MKIYTYYEEINHRKQTDLIKLWKASWEKKGFEAIVLSRSDAEAHSYYDHFIKCMSEIYTMFTGKQIGIYGLSCWVRWLAYATQPDGDVYTSDYDVINNNFKPKEIDPKIHSMGGHSPCFVSGTPAQFTELCHLMVSLSYKLYDKRGAVGHYHDQEFFAYNRQQVKFKELIKITGPMDKHRVVDCMIPGKKLKPAIHLSHNCIKRHYKPLGGSTIETRLKLAESIISMNEK